MFLIAGGPHPRIAETLALQDEGIKHREPVCDCDEQAAEELRQYFGWLAKGNILEAN